MWQQTQTEIYSSMHKILLQLNKVNNLESTESESEFGGFESSDSDTGSENNFNIGDRRECIS